MSRFLAIAFGGALGALARYGVANYVAARVGTRFPAGTFVVNMSACVLIGFVLTLFARRPQLDPVWRFLVPVGFIGAYSTFSTLEWELFFNIEVGAALIAAGYAAASLAGGLVAVWLGVLLARLVL